MTEGRSRNEIRSYRPGNRPGNRWGCDKGTTKAVGGEVFSTYGNVCRIDENRSGVSIQPQLMGNTHLDSAETFFMLTFMYSNTVDDRNNYVKRTKYTVLGICL
jgi:hypothetical protein